jgi:RHS repeat-associated protein
VIFKSTICGTRGQYYDIETGLSYNYFRDYDPGTGRYIESDPIGLDGGSYSTYAYVDDNPLSDWDETGEAKSGGPYHPPVGVGFKCYWDDYCSVLKGKMWILERMINSHQLWDWIMGSPRGGGRHAKEIATLWNAYARCQSIHNEKCKDCPPRAPGTPVPLPEWPPVGVPVRPTVAPPELVPAL